MIRTRRKSLQQGCGRKGMAALEFALIAPVILTMVLGTLEISDALRIQAKLNFAAGQLAQMIAASSSITTGSSDGPGGTLGDLCTAASYNLLPYPATTLYARIESSTVSTNASTGQDWAEDSACPTVKKSGSFTETIALTAIANSPRSMFTADGTPPSQGGTEITGYTAISLELFYTYTNPVHFLLGKTMAFTAVGVARPRSGVAPICTYPSGSGTAPCPGVY